jgi:hypothetical protein
MSLCLCVYLSIINCNCMWISFHFRTKLDGANSAVSHLCHWIPLGQWIFRFVLISSRRSFSAEYDGRRLKEKRKWEFFRFPPKPFAFYLIVFCRKWHESNGECPFGLICSKANRWLGENHEHEAWKRSDENDAKMMGNNLKKNHMNWAAMISFWLASTCWI